MGPDVDVGGQHPFGRAQSVVVVEGLGHPVGGEDVGGDVVDRRRPDGDDLHPVAVVLAAETQTDSMPTYFDRVAGAEAARGMPTGGVCRRSKHSRADRHLVHELVVLAVDRAFGDDLRMHGHPGEELFLVRPRWTEPLAPDPILQPAPRGGCGPDRRAVLQVVPDVDALVAFSGWPASHPTGVVGVGLVRDADVAAVVAAPHPAVKPALNAALDHAAAVGQVGAHVLAVRIEDADDAVEVPGTPPAPRRSSAAA